ncbi:MAG: thiosulfate oxidation carrier protein SoxY [Pseudomonadota bacterium]
MKFTKRELFALTAGSAAALTGLSALAPVAAKTTDLDDAISKFAGGKAVKEGRVSLTTPEIAENGNTVPVSVDVESPMTDADHVSEVLLLADGNPRPGVAKFKFTPMSGEASATTRIRLAKTQNVVAVAKMSDGSVFMAKSLVKVTIGGCGG